MAGDAPPRAVLAREPHRHSGQSVRRDARGAAEARAMSERLSAAQIVAASAATPPAWSAGQLLFKLAAGSRRRPTARSASACSACCKRSISCSRSCSTPALSRPLGVAAHLHAAVARLSVRRAGLCADAAARHPHFRRTVLDPARDRHCADPVRPAVRGRMSMASSAFRIVIAAYQRKRA